MRVARVSPEARVVDGKIHVLGGCKDKNYYNWGEVFDPKTQTWSDMEISKPMLENVYVVDSWSRSFYDLERPSKWGIGHNQDSKRPNSVDSKDWCVIDKMIYSCGVDGYIYCCKPREDLDRCDDAVGIYWMKVFKLDFLHYRLCDSRAVHFGGKMVKLWESYKLMFNINKSLEELLPENKLTNLGQNLLVFWEELKRDFVNKRLEIYFAKAPLGRPSVDNNWGRESCTRILTIDLHTVDPLLYNSTTKILYYVPVNV